MISYLGNAAASGQKLDEPLLVGPALLGARPRAREDRRRGVLRRETGDRLEGCAVGSRHHIRIVRGSSTSLGLLLLLLTVVLLLLSLLAFGSDLVLVELGGASEEAATERSSVVQLIDRARGLRALALATVKLRVAEFSALDDQRLVVRSLGFTERRSGPGAGGRSWIVVVRDRSVRDYRSNGNVNRSVSDNWDRAGGRRGVRERARMGHQLMGERRRTGRQRRRFGQYRWTTLELGGRLVELDEGRASRTDYHALFDVVELLLNRWSSYLSGY